MSSLIGVHLSRQWWQQGAGLRESDCSESPCWYTWKEERGIYFLRLSCRIYTWCSESGLGWSPVVWELQIHFNSSSLKHCVSPTPKLDVYNVPVGLRRGRQLFRCFNGKTMYVWFFCWNHQRLQVPAVWVQLWLGVILSAKPLLLIGFVQLNSERYLWPYKCESRCCSTIVAPGLCLCIIHSCDFMVLWAYSLGPDFIKIKSTVCSSEGICDKSLCFLKLFWTSDLLCFSLITKIVWRPRNVSDWFRRMVAKLF